MQNVSARMRSIVWWVMMCAAFGALLVCAAPGWGKPTGGYYEQEMDRDRIPARGAPRSRPEYRFAQAEEQRGPSYNRRLRDNAQEWEKLPPRRQDELRHNMDRFKNLPPEERRLYEKRHRQMQQLPPDEQQELRSKLRKKDRLSTEEKEEIRKKFR